MRFLEECEITANVEIAPGQYRMRLFAPNIARNSKAGQFCMLQVASGLEPFLRRPMCFERIFSREVTILYKIEGEGTRLISHMIPGMKLPVQGPLGNGFPIDMKFDRHIIVAGGIGVATFPGLAAALKDGTGRSPEVILAARSKSFLLCVEDFREMGCRVHIATDDGSAGEQLFASEMLKKLAPKSGTRVYACGPMAMMMTTSEVAIDAGADCLVSLEAQMACGDGACLGCVVESTFELEGEKMVRVCVDGPVFDTRYIDWKSHDLAYHL